MDEPCELPAPPSETPAVSASPSLLLRRKAEKVGEPPGTARYLGPAREFAPSVEYFTWSENQLDHRSLSRPFQVPPPVEGQVSWIKVTGIHDAALVEAMAQEVGASRLFIEDILNTAQRPKLEEEGDLVFIVLKLPIYDPRNHRVRDEQLAILWTPQRVVTFAEDPCNGWDALASRLQREKSRLRRSGLDYLVISLLDSVVDRYFLTLGLLGEAIEQVETQVIAQQTEDNLLRMYHYKREVLNMRNTLWPLEEILTQIARDDEGGEVAPQNEGYLRDVLDHVKQAVDGLKTLHDMLASMLDLHVNLTGMRLNHIMKYLTVIATIFMPLQWIAGVYGMNFEHMPELKWLWGYPASLAIMAVVGVGLWLFFWRRRWL